MKRKRSAALLSFAVGALFCLLAACKKPRSSVLAISHVTVIDMTGAPSAPDQTVLIDKEKIIALGPSNSISIPYGAKVLDARGRFLIPGLSDMHVHLTGAGEPNGSRKFLLPLLVANGITTVRDMGGSVELLKGLREEIATGKLLGPQIFFTGPYLDGNPPAYQPSFTVKTADEARNAVDLLASERVGFIKTQSRLDRDAYFAIAEESKKKGIRFVGHVPDRVSALEASDAGQASIEHLTGVLLACSTKESQLREEQFASGRPGETSENALARSRAWQRNLLDSYSAEKAGALFQTFVRNNTWQVPTFPILAHFGFMTPRTDLSQDPRMKYVPRNERALWSQGIKERLESRSETDFALREEIIKRYLTIVGEMRKAGVRFMAGTDTAAPNVLPGFSLHEDLALLVQAGLTPMEALQAATRNPAEFLGHLDSQGTIAAGKTADLVLLDANPLDDIHNTERIHAVVVRGKLLDRAALDQLLADIEEFVVRN